MKKIRVFPMILCIALLLQMVPLRGLAAQSQTTDTMPTETLPVEPTTVSDTAESDFGRFSVENGCHTIDGKKPLGGSDRRLDTAAAAFLYEINTDSVIYAYNPDMAVSPGSLTKIVTAIVALQYCRLDDEVIVKEGIRGRIPAGMTMNLKNNEIMTVRDLLHGLIMVNACDAAVAIAEHISGNRQGFVPLMNQWAKEIGCTGTEFATVHGVDGGLSITTARDMAKIVRAAIQNEDFAQLFSEKEYTVEATNVSEKRAKLQTLNYMMDEAIISQFYDRNVTGGFPSYETSSGASLVVTKSYKNMDYIGVVMSATRTFDTVKSWNPTIYGNFEEMAELLKIGYNNYKINRIIYDGMSLSQFRVNGGESNAVGCARVDVDAIVPINAQMKNLTIDYVLDGYLTAPIKEGQRLGTMKISYRDSCLAEAEVFAMGDVKQSDQTGVKIVSAAEKEESGASKVLKVIGAVCLLIFTAAVAYLSLNAYMRARIRAQRRKRRAGRRRVR